MSLCPVCETFNTEYGLPACNECLDEHGENAEHLEQVSAGDPVQVSEKSIQFSDGWQPIETAPKDGTRVLVYAPGHLHMIGAWLTVTGLYNYQPTWWSNNSTIHPSPTHWMPLPALPAKEPRS